MKYICKVITLQSESTLPVLKQSDKAVIIGHSGSGKTTLLAYILQHQVKFSPVFIVDTANQLSYVPSYNYTGATKCKHERKGQHCLKLHTEFQLETFISKLNKKSGKFFIVVDEIDRFTTPYSLTPEVKLWLEEGRNFDRGGIFTVRRVGFLNKSILGNAHYLYLFKVNNKRDREYLGSLVDYDINSLVYSNEHSFFVFDLYTSKLLGEFTILL